ncbi:MAG: ABC transporter substrate-binding protein [Chloroflexota bacterium]
MTIGQFGGRVSRRSVLEGIGVGALGLAGAALLGCGGTKSGGEAGGASSGALGVNQPKGTGLPLTAPVVQGKEKAGGTFTEHTTSSYTQHDPHTALATNIWHVIGDKGLEPDPQTAAIRPHVLTSWEVADPTTLVFKVKPGIKTHNMAPWNGRDFTAEDVAWNLERIGGLYAEKLKVPAASFQRASMVANITKAQAVDPTTVKVTLSKPNSSFFNGLMDTRVPFAPKEMDDIGWNDPLKMGGIGPFQISEWVKDQKMNYKKNPNYFRPNEPHFDNFNWTIIPDRASAVAAFISGQTNMISALNQLEIDQIKKTKPDANLYAWIDSNWHHFRPSVEYAPFKDIRVRKALQLAIDYAQIMDGFYGSGWGYQAALNPGFPDSWKPEKVKSLAGYNPDTKAADRAEAQKLLTAAGFPNGKGIDFQIIFQNTSGTAYPENCQRFQAQMQQVFPEMKIGLKPYADNASFSVPQAKGDFQMVSYVITAAPDSVIEMQSQYYTGGSRNYGHFSDKNLDALIDKAQVELKMDARNALMEEFQTKFTTEWVPMYVLGAQPARVMMQGNVAGYDTTAGTWYGYSASTKACRWFYVDK